MGANRCYHVWQMAHTGDIYYRVRRCFSSRSGANQAARQGVIEGRDGKHIDGKAFRPTMIKPCEPGWCPCHRQCQK